MPKPLMILSVFAVAFAFGVSLVCLFTAEAQAKPNNCILTIEPFYYCIESPSCKGPGEMRCWQCHGWDLYGEPCLCVRVGCMVPPQ